MTLWKIEIFDNKEDSEPSRTGYVDAPSEAEATALATEAMGSANRVDMTPAAVVSQIPPGSIVWVP
jgi:hypothetical protein